MYTARTVTATTSPLPLGRRLATSILRIGDVDVPITSSSSSKLVPRGTLPSSSSSDLSASLPPRLVRDLRWMAQKDKLGQDMFLLGLPGPARRRLALMYAELTGREVEIVTLSRDTTESCLKQRREIIGRSAIFSDQPPVRAALNGRLLILEGIEKAERNVLPTLNNLLENREMHLDDGRFLMAPKTFDELAREMSPSEMAEKGILRVHDNFRVLALGLPVPPFPGRSLDPHCAVGFKREPSIPQRSMTCMRSCFERWEGGIAVVPREEVTPRLSYEILCTRSRRFERYERATTPFRPFPSPPWRRLPVCSHHVRTLRWRTLFVERLPCT